MKKALLIVDIQNDYFEQGAWELVGSTAASLQAQKVLHHFRKEHLPIIHIQHFAVGEGLPFFKPNTPGVEIHDNVKPLASEKVIAKHYPNSFKETELLEYLQENGITSLVIMGMMTHMCIDATTRAAKDFGFDCTVISDACASRDLELQGKTVKASEVHTAFLSALGFAYANVLPAEVYLTSNNQ